VSALRLDAPAPPGYARGDDGALVCQTCGRRVGGVGPRGTARGAIKSHEASHYHASHKLLARCIALRLVPVPSLSPSIVAALPELDSVMFGGSLAVLVRAAQDRQALVCVRLDDAPHAPDGAEPYAPAVAPDVAEDIIADPALSPLARGGMAQVLAAYRRCVATGEPWWMARSAPR
jgi:hypothetical protein